jgi:electron transport complex protein RnfG
MKNDFIFPVIALAVICSIVSGTLAAANAKTLPIIEQAADERAIAVRKEIMPDADGFIQIDVKGLPSRVAEVFEATNGIGYIFTVKTAGYGGDVTIACGIAPDGLIIKTAVLSHTETKGISDPVFEMESEYAGKDRNLEGIDAISGATISSNAYKNAVLDAFAAFEIITNKEGTA